MTERPLVAADRMWSFAADSAVLDRKYGVRIAMIGGGYVGLVSGACFADLGVEVAVVEVDPAKLAALSEGRIPIYEPGLDRLVADNVAAGRLSFGNDLAAAVAGAEAVFIAVGTPARRGDGHADLTYVYAAAEQVAQALTGPAVIVTKSTVPVGTGRRIAQIMADVPAPTCCPTSPATSRPIPNSCARAARSTISCARIGW